MRLGPARCLAGADPVGDVDRGDAGAIAAVGGVAHRCDGQVGFIASVSKPFCLNCNRIRLTSDGKLRYCLFAVEETDVRDLLRANGSDEAVADAIRENIRQKWIGHEINTQKFVPPPRPMYSIGG